MNTQLKSEALPIANCLASSEDRYECSRCLHPKSITNGHCSHCATIEVSLCPDCGGEIFRDEGRVTWCRDCGWNKSPSAFTGRVEVVGRLSNTYWSPWFAELMKLAALHGITTSNYADLWWYDFGIGKTPQESMEGFLHSDEGLNEIAASDSPPITNCDLYFLNKAARQYRKEHYQRANADSADTEARDAYYYEEGRTRAYSEGINALEFQGVTYEKRIKHLENQIAHLSGVNVDINIRRHLAECERDELIEEKLINRQRIESLKDHCRKVNPSWSWLMREVLAIIDPQSSDGKETRASQSDCVD